MTSICFNRLGRVLVTAMLAGAAFEFLPGALAFSYTTPPHSNQDGWDFTNGTPRAIPRRASIIFMQVDGLGYGDLSCYGQTNFQTPILDKLAAEGIQFTNYSIADTSSLSQAALMLGENSRQQHQRSLRITTRQLKHGVLELVVLPELDEGLQLERQQGRIIGLQSQRRVDRGERRGPISRLDVASIRTEIIGNAVAFARDQPPL